MSKPPIFVVGFQRSGTTLLQSLLGSHPNIAAPPEIHFIFRVARFADRYGDLDDDANLRRAVNDALHPPIDVLEKSGFDDERVFQRARAGERSMRGVLDAIMSDYAARQGKCRWSEKSPGQRAADVYRLIPDAQVIHIVRDPRDAIASSIEAPWILEGVHSLAHAWRNFTLHNVRTGLKAGPGRFLQLRYEDLTRDPESVLQVIFAFLGEPYAPEVLTNIEERRGAIATVTAPWQANVLQPVTASREGGWRSRLSKRDRLIAQAVVHRELATLGYARSPRRAIVMGTAMDWPHMARDSIRRRLVRRKLRDPTRLDRAITDFLQEQARVMQAARAASASPASPD